MDKLMRLQVKDTGKAMQVCDMAGARVCSISTEVLDQIAFAKLFAASPTMLAALLAVRDGLGIRKDFVPLGPALELAPIINAAIAAAYIEEGV